MHTVQRLLLEVLKLFIERRLEYCLCDVQTAVTVFDLLDYYESCERLNISYNKNLGIRGWQACARFIKKVCIATLLVHCV